MRRKELFGHPMGLYILFLTEMWERFSYYGMRAIFILYLTKALLMDTEAAGSIYGIYTSLVYATPLLGGFIADRYWGNRRSILVGGILMAIAQFLMFQKNHPFIIVFRAENVLQWNFSLISGVHGIAKTMMLLSTSFKNELCKQFASAKLVSRV